MNRRQFIKGMPFKLCVAMIAANVTAMRSLFADENGSLFRDTPTAKDWLARWQEHILGEAAHVRYCGQEMGKGVKKGSNYSLDMIARGWQSI